MHDALAVLVIAKRLQRQRQQRGFLFGKHGGHLPLGGAVDARVGPALFPVIEVGLGFFQTLEAQAFQRCFLRMTDAGFDFAFAIRISNAARHGDGAVVREHVAIERIERGIVDVGNEHAFASDCRARRRAWRRPAGERLVRATRPRCANWSGSVSRRTDLRLKPSVSTNSRVRRYLPVLRVAHHGAGAVIDLRLLAGRGDDDDASFRRLRSAPLAHEALHALVAAGEAVLGDQVLPDGPRIPTSAEPQVDGFPVRLAGAGTGDHGQSR